MNAKTMEANSTNCPTCPFLDTGWVHLREFLMQRAMTEGTPICHSTGKTLVARKKRISKAPRLCAGARQYQAEQFYAMGFLDAPTVEAWDKKREELGI